MTISESLSKLCELDDYKNLSNSQIYSILSDYGVFNEYPKFRLALKAAIDYGLWQLLKFGAKSNEIFVLNTKLLNDGFNEQVVQEIINCLSLASNVHNSDSSCIDGQKFDKRNIASYHGYNHIKFWGTNLGQNIDCIDKYLKEKGYVFSKYNDSKDVKKLYNALGRTEMFLGYGSGIYVYESPYSKSVYKIEVYLSKAITKTLMIYNELHPLLIQKYGIPYRDDDIRKYGPQEGKGIFFEIPEGRISMCFGRYFEGQYSLYLNYEDKITSKKVLSEIIQYKEEMRIEKESNDRQYQEKLFKDL
ncbi:MAG: hypothetical protein J1F16_10360 [Muribaculaceae bacterium]|nr:hypothetical protein [Muribaculaceae bacterium]